MTTEKFPLPFVPTLDDLAAICHRANAKWWRDASGKKLERNKGELLCLIHSEISEAMEAERKNLMSEKLPDLKGVEEELADALIRIFDYAGAFDLCLQAAFNEKMNYNASRLDHTHEERVKAHGKKW